MANKQVKNQQKSDKTALICLISLIVIIVAVVVVLVVFWGQETNDARNPKPTAAATDAPMPEELQGDKITLDTTPVGSITRDENTGACDMDAVRDEIDSKKLTDFELADEVTEYVLFEVKGFGSYVLKLRADVAPVSVCNFQNLVARNFYDGKSFHRIMKGFMIQGGAPVSSAEDAALTAIKGEFSANGLRNELSHITGVISMARTTVMDSATSQFFISNDSVNTPRSLDGNYAGFGYVVAGLDTVLAISDVQVTYSQRGEASVPMQDVIIERACFVKLK